MIGGGRLAISVLRGEGPPDNWSRVGVTLKMRPLVETPGSNAEHQDLIELLLANGVRYQEKSSGFLMPATIWVEEDDHAKAFEIASSVAARHAMRTKAEWDREWKERRVHTSAGCSPTFTSQASSSGCSCSSSCWGCSWFTRWSTFSAAVCRRGELLSSRRPLIAGVIVITGRLGEHALNGRRTSWRCGEPRTRQCT
jgi:hypothetical protein